MARGRLWPTLMVCGPHATVSLRVLSFLPSSSTQRGVRVRSRWSVPAVGALRPSDEGEVAPVVPAVAAAVAPLVDAGDVACVATALAFADAAVAEGRAE